MRLYLASVVLLTVLGFTGCSTVAQPACSALTRGSEWCGLVNVGLLAAQEIRAIRAAASDTKDATEEEGDGDS